MTPGFYRFTACCSFSLLLLSLSGCRDSSSALASPGPSAAISGAPVLNSEYGARNPRACEKVTKAPSVAEAQALVQCGLEGFFPGPALFLVTDVKIEMGAARNQTPLDGTNDLDPRSKIYPLRGSLTKYSCGLVAQYGAGTNCQKWPAATGGDAPGRCWQTSFGDWKCTLTGGYAPQFIQHVAGPTGY